MINYTFQSTNRADGLEIPLQPLRGEQPIQEVAQYRPCTSYLGSRALTLALGVSFFIQQTFIDGFDTAEVIDYLATTIEELTHQQEAFLEAGGGEESKEVNGTYLYYGIALSVLSSVMLTLVMLHYRQRKHSHHHEHQGVMGQIMHTGSHLAFIATPFAMIGFGGMLESTPNASPFVQYTAATITGLLAGYGAMVVHGFNADEFSAGGGLRGYLAAVGDSLILAPGRYAMDHSTMVGVRNLWQKWFILFGHFCEGLFASTIFLRGTGLENTWLSLPLKVGLSTSIMIFEGMSEALSIDKRMGLVSAFASSPHNPRSCPLQVLVFSREALKISAGIVHNYPIILGASELLETSAWFILKQMLGEVAVKEMLSASGYISLGAIAGSTTLFLYPNVSGFYHLVSDSVDETFEAVGVTIGQGAKKAQEAALSVRNTVCTRGFFCSAKTARPKKVHYDPIPSTSTVSNYPQLTSL